MTRKTRILILYTGGTFGMSYNEQGALIPFDFAHLNRYLPMLHNLSVDIEVQAFDKPIDSSNIQLAHWQQMATLIQKNYEAFDGFIVLHGTDTMAYSASALSFMLRGMRKPVIFTGAQLPINSLRTDARENLLTAIEIASAKKGDEPYIQEVCILFNNELLRGNRSKKVQSIHFDAFESENYPFLARAGVQIQYNDARLLHPSGVWNVLTNMNSHLFVLKIFPGLSDTIIKPILAQPELKGVIIETYGAGNAPNHASFIALLADFIEQGKPIINISQCAGGAVIHGKYDTSKQLEEIGVISGGDMTLEAAVTKLMLCLGNPTKFPSVSKEFSTDWAGEISLT